ERVAYEMVEDAARDNLRYLEVRYCPHLSRKRGMTLDEVIEAELRGFARGERDFGVIARVINCSLRHYDPAVSVEIARRSVAFRDRGVVAFDLAGAEDGRPAGAHKAAFDLAAQGYLGITVHAGEAAGAESVAEAVHLCHANRIGHGTRLHPRGDRPIDPQRICQCLSAMARAGRASATGGGRARRDLTGEESHETLVAGHSPLRRRVGRGLDGAGADLARRQRLAGR